MKNIFRLNKQGKVGANVPAEKIQYEVCVRCNKETDIPTITPVEYRSDYILGVGQLCIKCAEKMDIKPGSSELY